MWTRYPDLFHHCFQCDQKRLAQAINNASRAFAVSLPKPAAAHFLLFRRALPSKTKCRVFAVVVRSNSTSSISKTKVGFFCFCFILLRLFIVFHFAFGAYLLSHASMIRKLRTLLPRATSTWSNTEERHWQATGNKQKSGIWARCEPVAVNIHVEHKGRNFQVEARFHVSWDLSMSVWTGSPDWRWYDTCGHPKRDLFENGSFWRCIRVHVASVFLLALWIEWRDWIVLSHLSMSPLPLRVSIENKKSVSSHDSQFIQTNIPRPFQAPPLDSGRLCVRQI